MYWNPHVYLPGGNPEPFFASESQHIDPALLKDRLYREWLAVTNCQAPEFLKAMEKYKFRNTDVMAYYAWVAGDWKKAHKYIAMLEKPTLLSLYIEAQLARMAGNSDLTLKKLHAWLKMVKDLRRH